MTFIPTLTAMLALLAVNAYASGSLEVVGPSAIDLGRFRAWKKQTARYTIRNAGHGLLKVKSVKAACACATTSCSLKELKKGRQAVIEVAIIPNSIFGRFKKTVYIETSDADRRYTNLSIAGEAVPLVTVSPACYINAGHIETNKHWTQSFELTPNLPGLTLGKPEVRSSHAVKAALNRVPGKDAAYRLDLALRPTGKSGDLRCVVAMPVEAPPGHQDVQVHVVAGIGTSLRAFPSVIALPRAAKPVVRTFRLRLPRETTLALDPARISFPQIEGTHIKVAREKGAKGVLVTATFDAAFLARLKFLEEVALTFELPGAASATVKVRPDRPIIAPKGRIRG